MPERRTRASTWRGILAGVIGGGLVVGVAELIALVFGSSSAPFIGIGGAFIDRIPPGVKDLVVGLFGTADKAVLFASMGAVYIVITAAIGLLGLRAPRAAEAVLGVLALGAAAVVATRPGNVAADAIPTMAGAVVGVLALHLLLRRTAEAQDAGGRRRFLRTAGIAAGVGVIAGAVGRGVGAARERAAAIRSSFTLPAPAVPAEAIPADAQVDVPGMPPYLTPAADFYRIDTALAVPQVDPQTWRLKITGMVDKPLTLSLEDLLKDPLTEANVTLTCVSNAVGGDLAGNATWLGVPIRSVLERVGVQAGADMVLSRSVDGFTASTPLEALTDSRNALFAVGMNGAPLPAEHGYPVRMVVPGLYGYVSATKWVEELTVTRFADATAYWTDRGWSEKGPIKIASRVDVPKTLAAVDAGTVRVGGTAWAQQRGIAGVEVRIDDGDWRPAELGGEVNDDCWRQWSYTWEGATAGNHTVTVRATDGQGELQTEKRADPIPDGASGWHSIQFRVR
ncbi:molybdopterin-dependent oxidoreductase [Brachybacterium sp. AOP25-B2-12]|uniref:molybdopterin-dependent oxidoreductase n=1 Tax=Brachybacterium sp. AOP25-B2-12 TaxID=3457710 RepID=UPI00403373EE